MRKNPFSIVREFEEAIAEYTGAPYAVAVDSCTNAIWLSIVWWGMHNSIFGTIKVPKKTYLSVPQSVIHAGYRPEFVDLEWQGCYQLHPTTVWDSAKRLTSKMYIAHQYMCLSFHIKKALPLGKGGCILTSNEEAVEWFKKARYEGRSEKPYKEDDVSFCGWNMYMRPEDAARGLALLQNYPENMPDQIEEGGYRDLTTMPLFKGM